MSRNSRRHSTGFGYIGFGNSQSTFNQRSSKPFSVYKEKLDLEAHLHYKMDFLHKDLTKEEKDIIKNTIRKNEKRLFIKTITISICFFILFCLVVYYFINQIRH